MPGAEGGRLVRGEEYQSATPPTWWRQADGHGEPALECGDRSGQRDRDPLRLRFRPADGLPGGAYDELITAGLDEILRRPGVQTEIDQLDSAEATEVLAAHLEKVATRVFASLPFGRRLAVANGVLTRLIQETGQASADQHLGRPVHLCGG